MKQLWGYLRSAKLFETPYVYLLVIFLSLLGIYLVSIIQFPDYSRTRAWISRLAVTVFGSYLVVILIDASFRRREQNEKEHIQNLALKRLRTKMNRHLQFLTTLYVVSMEDNPEDIPQSYDEFFGPEYLETVKYLDLSTEHSGRPWDDFFEYTGDEAEKFRNDIDEILKTYGPFLDSDMFSTFQSLADSSFLGMVGTFSDIDHLLLDAEMGVVRDYNYFNGQNIDNIFATHLESVLEVIEYYEQPDAPNLNSLDSLDVWRDDVNPEFGTARINKPLENTEPRFMAGEGPLPRFSDS